MLKYIIPLVFIVGCTRAEEVEPKINECAYILTRIVNIQEIREASRKDFHITVEDKRGGKVSNAVWHKERDRWLAQENKLATTANHLYTEARAKACFDNMEDKDER